MESYVRWPFAGVVREEVACFAGYSVGGVDKACQGGKCMADGVDGVADVVAEDLFAVFALEEVVAVGVEGFAAVVAGTGLGGRWDDW